MSIYDRDFIILTDPEIEELIEYNEQTRRSIKDILKTEKGLSLRELSPALRHYKSLFPNNYMDIVELEKKAELERKIINFESLINNPSTIERQVLKHFKDTKDYFIISSILKRFPFGHHDAFVFREFQLSNNYTADFLLVGKNSDGYHFVFVELEGPYGNVTLKSGDFGEIIRTGINQVDSWNRWLQSNYDHLVTTYKKQKHPERTLPDEFRDFDSSRIHYVVIAGRRKNFDDVTRREKRELESRRVLLLHYDNLIDSARAIIGKATY